jgi:hypothetical protein
MRWILPVGCLLVLTAILCGCIQSPSAAPVTPAPTSGVSVFILPDTTATPHPGPVRGVNITADETSSSVIIRVDGGNDAAALTSLNVRITNLDGTFIQRTIQSPVIGKPYSIQYFRIANAANVNIIGTFSDGYQQTLLMTSF